MQSCLKGVFNFALLAQISRFVNTLGVLHTQGTKGFGTAMRSLPALHVCLQLSLDLTLRLLLMFDGNTQLVEKLCTVTEQLRGDGLTRHRSRLTHVVVVVILQFPHLDGLRIQPLAAFSQHTGARVFSVTADFRDRIQSSAATLWHLCPHSLESVHEN